ncbi:hypothetical protein NW943_00195 [Staphylococcus aureus]|nr:hypothetical protein NW943_00195 [Staphylococcus aureus]
MQVGAQHREIGFLISTDIASWRGQHSEIGSSISTDIASWGNEYQTQKLAESQLL